ncbi:MAG: hypothetical protein JWM10_648, partial [Myxococcaceae bacterium]|nr:hypothetical protein [Myxococcaceae bacterium]
WREALDAVAADTRGGYRGAARDVERVARVLEDPAALAEQRTGAAYVLSSHPDAALHERVRIAVDACACTNVRVAIDRAGAGELDEAPREASNAVPARRA